MKNRVWVIILALIAIGFGVALIVVEKQARERESLDAKTIGNYSNKWVATSANLAEQVQVSAINEKKLENQQRTIEQLTNSVTETLANLAQISGNLTQSETSLKASKEEIVKRDARIADLEQQNHALDTQALDLSNAITNLNVEIAETRKKLATSEGDKTFLEGQLKRLLVEKSELERQFNDITVLKGQIRKLRDEIIVARRIDWARRGVYARSERKGAQGLMQGAAASQSNPPRPNYDLNAEIGSQGGARIVPAQTNNIPSTNSAPK